MMVGGLGEMLGVAGAAVVLAGLAVAGAALLLGVSISEQFAAGWRLVGHAGDDLRVRRGDGRRIERRRGRRAETIRPAARQVGTVEQVAASPSLATMAPAAAVSVGASRAVE